MHKKVNIDIHMTATVDKDAAVKLLADAVEKQTGKKVNDVKITYEDNAFSGFTIIFDPILPRQSFKPSKEFIVNHFGAEE